MSFHLKRKMINMVWTLIILEFQKIITKIQITLLINNQIKGRGIPTGTGCIVPLQSLIPAPWRKSDLSDWYIKY
jgi:hypothetical protein